MHETVEKFLSEEKHPEKYNFEYEFPVKNYDDNLPVFDRYFIYQAYKASPGLRYEHKNKNLFKKKLGKVKGLEQYIDTYHTLGNFVLVPAGFNRARALRTQDFWDKSLGLLKNEGFDTLRSSRFEEKQFHRYINYFFLWDCMAIKDGKYDVRFLFPLEDGKEEKKKRRTQKEKLEESKKQIEDFLKAACECIERRGIFIAAMLKNALRVPDIYKEIQDKVFLTDGTYSGYGEVIGKIEEVTKDASASKLVEEILKECEIERLFAERDKDKIKRTRAEEHKV